MVLATLEPPPAKLGVTHWSSRLLAEQLGISNVWVARIWRKWGLQPWRRETFKFSTDPQLEAKVRDVVGLYLNPPDKAVVLSIDEKVQIQALDRTAPILPMRPGLPEKATHDYVRHGTTTLFAALEVATGKVTDACYPRHRHEEFLRFLKHVAKTYPRVKLHIVCRQLRHPQTPHGQAWLARNPRITMHFTPTSGSWLNMVEIFFGIITRQAIRRGTFTSVKDLIAAIETFIDGWNERCQPFTWTKTADEILTKATRGQRTHRSRDTRAVTPRIPEYKAGVLAVSEWESAGAAVAGSGIFVAARGICLRNAWGTVGPCFSGRGGWLLCCSWAWWGLSCRPVLRVGCLGRRLGLRRRPGRRRRSSCRGLGRVSRCRVLSRQRTSRSTRWPRGIRRLIPPSVSWGRTSRSRASSTPTPPGGGPVHSSLYCIDI